MVEPSPALRQRLRHVYWIGGGSGAGKSTAAGKLASMHGLRVYSTDDVMPDHARRADAEQSPYLARFIGMDMDERWVNRSPEVMLDTFHWYRGEGFSLIVDDLLQMPRDVGVVVEGFRLLPRLIWPLLAEPGHAVWLLPTPEFRRVAFSARGWPIPSGTSDPDRARRNLLERDRMFTDYLAAETERLELPALGVDIGMGERELVRQVEFTLRLP